MTTHTYAILDVPHAVYMAVRAILTRAGYEHAFNASKSDGELIDMHGIALRSAGGSGTTEISLNTLIGKDEAGAPTGKIDFQVNGELAQMDLVKAREVVRMLHEAIEAAVSDELVYRFLVDRIALPPEKIAGILLDFREMRQGSRGIVHPH